MRCMGEAPADVAFLGGAWRGLARLHPLSATGKDRHQALTARRAKGLLPRLACPPPSPSASTGSLGHRPGPRDEGGVGCVPPAPPPFRGLPCCSHGRDAAVARRAAGLAGVEFLLVFF
jgi:hypothetical protein